MDLHYCDLLELAILVRSREVSPVEITRAQLKRIEHIDSSLRSYARTYPDLALESARQAEAEIVAGRYRGPLHGVPIALKDLFWIKGYPSAAGTAIHRDFRAKEDATVIRRLKVAGAILLGSLQLTEGAYAAHLPPIQPPVNPWNANYWSGASSSGSGVAIAAGLCYGSLGTETGGSIHLPSAANGVTGLKPTWGRVSRHGVFELAATLDHVGPFARSAADLAALLSIVAGPDPQDPTAARHPLSDYMADTTRLPKIRIGLDARYAFQGVDRVTVEAVSGAIETMRALGAEIVDIEFPKVDGMVADWFPLCAVQTAVAHEGTYPSRKEEYGTALTDLIELGRGLSGMDYQRLILRRLAFSGRVDALFDIVDLIALPVITFSETTIDRMLRIDDDLISGVHRFTCPFTMSGHPAITLPCGFTASNTPVAFQFVGRRFDESLTLQAAHAYQAATNWHRRHPSL